MSDATKTLYERLGGYDAIAAVANDLLPETPLRSAAWALLGASRRKPLDHSVVQAAYLSPLMRDVSLAREKVGRPKAA